MKRRIVYIFLIIGLFFTFNTICEALTYGGCEYSEISRLKSLVSNINISYDYYIENNRAYFNITLNNIVPGMYFVDSNTNQKYNYYNSIEGEIVLTGYKDSGKFNFYSELNACYGIKLGSKYYRFPTYNFYYENSLCDGNQNHSLCKKWANITYSYDEFRNLIEEYNKNKDELDENVENEVIYEKTYLDVFVNFYVKYYYFILIGIIVICVIVMIINRRKNKFDL